MSGKNKTALEMQLTNSLVLSVHKDFLWPGVSIVIKLKLTEDDQSTVDTAPGVQGLRLSAGHSAPKSSIRGSVSRWGGRLTGRWRTRAALFFLGMPHFWRAVAVHSCVSWHRRYVKKKKKKLVQLTPFLCFSVFFSQCAVSSTRLCSAITLTAFGSSTAWWVTCFQSSRLFRQKLEKMHKRPQLWKYQRAFIPEWDIKERRT